MQEFFGIHKNLHFHEYACYPYANQTCSTESTNLQLAAIDHFTHFNLQGEPQKFFLAPIILISATFIMRLNILCYHEVPEESEEFLNIRQKCPKL